MLANYSLAGVVEYLRRRSTMLSKSPTVAELTALCEQNPDLEITLENSYSAGNCTEGTKEFVADHFPGRDTVKAVELLPYIEGYSGVRIVLEYIFRRLERQAEAKESQDDLSDQHPF
jgi:hypothetical protein